MAPRENKLLMDIVAGQATLIEKVGNIETRLFGGEGQTGVIPVLFEKHESVQKDLQSVKDKITAEIKDIKEAAIKPVEDKIAALDKVSALVMWKIGSISSGAGALIGIGITTLLKKLFGVH